MLRQITPRTLVAVVYDYSPQFLRRIVDSKRKHSGSGLESANTEYCRRVWLKHLGNAFASGMPHYPERVGEIGPGQSLGVGLSALIMGSERYTAFDAVNLLRPAGHLAMFDKLAQTFKDRAAWAEAGNPSLFTAQYIARVTNDDRIDRLRQSVARLDADELKADDPHLSYSCPWDKVGLGSDDSLDLILSHASIMYVPDMDYVYREIGRVLSPDGRSSNQVDYSSVGFSKDWDGHWTFSKPVWNLISSRRPYRITRAPHSEHLRAIGSAGLEVAREHIATKLPSYPKSALAEEFQNMPSQDRETAGVLIALKKSEEP